MEISINIALNKIYIAYKSLKTICSNIIIINMIRIGNYLFLEK